MKTVLITGASSGIGFKTAELFLKKGYRVINFSRRGAPDERIINYGVDITDIKALEAALDDVKSKFIIDILVNSAGFSMAAPVERVKEEDYRYLFEVNFFAAIKIIKSILPNMAKGGRIINISSMGSASPIPYDPYYSASKAALDMLSICLNTELNNRIYVTSVLPGGTKTDFSFKRKVYETDDAQMNKAVNSLFNIEQSGMTAESVARRVYLIAVSKSPPVIAPAGAINRILYFVVRRLPARLIVFVTKKVFFR